MCNLSLQFPMLVAGEELGMAYGFPLAWHVSWVTSGSRIVWLPGLVANLIVATAFGMSCAIGVHTALTRGFISRRATGVLLGLVIFLACADAAVFISNFLDPYFVNHKSFDVKAPVRVAVVPFFR